MTLRVLSIVRGTSVDGPGLRTSIYLAGCRHACRNCHNPQSWNFEAGEEYTLEELMHEIEDEGFNVTLSGGDPLSHPEEVAALCSKIKEAGLKIWIYTGYSWEEIIDNERLREAVAAAEVVVDGRYIESLRDRDLLFRGSSNQRLIRVRESMERGEVVMWQP